MKKILLIIIVCVMLASCAGMGEDQTVGALSGGGIGMLAGSQIGQGAGRTASMMGGTAIGALMGSSVGQTMDQANDK